MKRSSMFSLACLALTQVAMAQDPDQNARPRALEQSTGVAVTPTTEMWFYEQERSRYDDPQQAVRRRAELRAAQRASRLAAMEWYGMSNSRPSANATPVTGSYAPTWTSPNTYDPNQWRPGRNSAPVYFLR